MTDGAPSADASSGQGGPDGYRPGWWPSPLSAAQVAAPGSRPSEVQRADGSIFWSESRPDEDGRVAVVRWNPERGAVDVVPSDADVRTRVNEYGGGAGRPTRLRVISITLRKPAGRLPTCQPVSVSLADLTANSFCQPARCSKRDLIACRATLRVTSSWVNMNCSTTCRRSLNNLARSNSPVPMSAHSFCM